MLLLLLPLLLQCCGRKRPNSDEEFIIEMQFVRCLNWRAAPDVKRVPRTDMCRARARIVCVCFHRDRLHIQHARDICINRHRRRARRDCGSPEAK